MTPQFSAESFPYKKLSIVKCDRAKASEAAAFFSSLDQDIAVTFDRALWSAVSAGQMPSQLFPFPGQTTESCALIFSNDSLDIPIGTVVREYFIEDVEISGSPGQQFDVEEDFDQALFVMLIEASRPPQIEEMINYSLKTDQGSFYICAGHNLYPADKWLEDQSSKEGFYLFAPSFELRGELSERASDSEKIHLDEEIKGIHL